MIKKIIFFITVSLLVYSNIYASEVEKTDINKIVALDWSAISGTEKLLTFVKESELTKRTKDQTEKGNEFYNKGISLMEKGDYSNAILEFKQAMKKYKRAKLNDDALNYIRTNMGLSYASQAGKSNQAAAKKQRVNKS